MYVQYMSVYLYNGIQVVSMVNWKTRYEFVTMMKYSNNNASSKG